MCFVNESEWMAEVYEKTQMAAPKPTRCMECRRKIGAEQMAHRIFLQEHEECRICSNGDCECQGGCCACPKPELGEAFTGWCCDDCERFLCAVEAAEREAGCHYSESRPMLEMMREAISGAGPEEAAKYFTMARQTQPEIEANGYLAWLWNDLFGEESAP